MKKFILFVLCAAFSLDASATYTNPILHSDYSDPDLICHDGEYWMTASSFNCVPGLQILHSTDLINWEIVNAALPNRVIAGDGSQSVEHGNGVWAPSIRYFNGKYWIFWGDPDNGIFQVHAEHPAGIWSEPVCVWAGKGVIDTCPLRDDDGRIYLVHAWAGSRAGFKSQLAVCELNEDCSAIISEQIQVFDGKKSDNDTVEGPKFYKRDGWYYIFAPSGGVKTGWQLVMRSKNVYGPYEYRNVLHQGSSNIHGPHQGGWVEDAEGQSWFMHFEDRYAYGRVCHLQPMEWGEDGWCTIGEDIDGDGIGEPVTKYRSPAAYPQKSYPRAVSALETRTGFTGTHIPWNWQWQASPQLNWAMLNPSEGYIRLNCVRAESDNLWETPNLLLEKVVGPKMELKAKLVFRPGYEGDRVGIVVMGLQYSTIEMSYREGKVFLRRSSCKDAEKGMAQEYGEEVEISGEKFYTVHMKLNVLEGAVCRFSYSLDGRKYRTLGEDFVMKEGKWIGAKAGFFATASIKKNDGGSVDVY